MNLLVKILLLRRRFAMALLTMLFYIWLRRKTRLHARDLRRIEFSHSTQKMGLRFNESLRDRLRRKWVRLQAALRN